MGKSYFFTGTLIFSTTVVFGCALAYFTVTKCPVFALLPTVTVVVFLLATLSLFHYPRGG